MSLHYNDNNHYEILINNIKVGVGADKVFSHNIGWEYNSNYFHENVWIRKILRICNVKIQKREH